MRDRSQSTTVASSDRTSLDLVTGATTTLAGANGSYNDTVSLMRDTVAGSRFITKPVTHLQYELDLQNMPFSVYNGSDMSNAPNPRTRYDGYMPYSGHQHKPSLASIDSYIPVTAHSTNDLDGCVFDAYNRFTNEYRGMDGSQSLAESGDFPKLFEMWSRRKSVPTNLVNGFLNYSFGWRPLISDLRSIAKELRSFPKAVRKMLKNKTPIVRHYKFNLDDTIENLVQVHASSPPTPYAWCGYEYKTTTGRKARKVVVTIRANIKPKLNGSGQATLEKLGRLGLIPSLATLWSITRLSFVVDWFYNIGGAIENLQGSLTHDVSDVSVCISDKRERVLELRSQALGGNGSATIIRFTELQTYYDRRSASVPLLPPVTLPSRPMQYILLGFLALTTTEGGQKILYTADRYEWRFNRYLKKLEDALNKRTLKLRSF